MNEKTDTGRMPWTMVRRDKMDFTERANFSGMSQFGPGVGICPVCDQRTDEFVECTICGQEMCDDCLPEDEICEACQEWIEAQLVDNLRLARAVLRGIERAYEDDPVLVSIARNLQRLCTPGVTI